MRNISTAFSSASDEGRAAMISYIMGGDPDGERFLSYGRAVAAHSDIIEVGIPFSDPVADGPSIQAAGLRSLSSGTRVGDVIGWCRELSEMLPVVVMCYYNTIHRMGEETFAGRLRDAGISGLIVPDLPLEEGAALRRFCRRNHVDSVLLATPATGPERAARIASSTSGFLYLVSRYGTTGERESLPDEALQLLAYYRQLCRTPVAVGCGVSSMDQVSQLAAAGADGIVVGSAIVSRIGSGQSAEEVGRFVSSLRDGTLSRRLPDPHA